MLGERRGTGDTEGVSYLERVRTIPLFAAGCPFGHGHLPASRAAAAEGEGAVDLLEPRSRSPLEQRRGAAQWRGSEATRGQTATAWLPKRSIRPPHATR